MDHRKRNILVESSIQGSALRIIVCLTAIYAPFVTHAGKADASLVLVFPCAPLLYGLTELVELGDVGVISITLALLCILVGLVERTGSRRSNLPVLIVVLVVLFIYSCTVSAWLRRSIDY